MSAREGSEDILNKLIQVEQDIINDLLKLMRAPDLETGELVKISNSIAYHANCLQKLLEQKAKKPEEKEDLATWLSRLPKKYREAARLWKKYVNA